MNKSHSTLYLIDISSFIFRAFYAVRELSAPDGTPVNAVYGVASMLGKLLDEVQPDYLAIVYDSKEPSFRKELYAEYKANRSAAPDALIPQFDLIEEMIHLFGLPSFRQSGIEADDLIATLRTRWLDADPSHRVVIVTGDKDLMALVNSKTMVWDTMKDVHYTPHEVIEKFGVAPNQVRDYLAIVGDASDNIPGIRGIGPKGAEVLLKEFKTLEGILEAAKKGLIKGKKCEQIVEGEKQALLSQDLATLRENLVLEISPESARFDFSVQPALVDFFKKYNLKQLVTKYTSRLIEGLGAVQLPPQDLQTKKVTGVWHCISTADQLQVLIKKINTTGTMAFDTETTSLDPRSARLVGISIAVDATDGYYIPLGHQQDLMSGQSVQQLDLQETLQKLKPVLESAEIKKIGQNVKYDYRIMLNQGIRMQGIYADTMLAAYTLDSSGRHNLDFLAQKYLNYHMLTYEEVTGKGAAQITFDEVPIETAVRYAAEDAWATFCLWEVLQARLKKSGTEVEKLFRDIDLPMVEVVANMEEAGICVDVPFLSQLEQQFDLELKEIEKSILTFSKSPTLNLNSPKQLAVFLFEDLKLPVQSKTKTGYSTDASVLEALANLHEAPKLLLEYREISKLKGTYVLPLQQLADPRDGRVRTSFHLTGTATGRLSSSDPNVQNIPVRSKRGQLIRQAFIAAEDCVLMAADYSQIELRILAHMSADPSLVDSFVRGQDVHRRTASEIYHVDSDRVTDEQRSVAKAINFGLMYGKTAFGLAEELKISRTDAKNMIARYFERYRGVKDFLDQQVLNAQANQFVTTLLGRKRALPEIASSNPMVRANAERMAMNSPIQGTASDLIKIAMRDLMKQFQLQNLKSRLLLQVHDELLIECPNSEIEVVQKCVVQVMEGALKLSVPLVVNVAVGKNWSEI
jgi:DNA polymerase-1